MMSNQKRYEDDWAEYKKKDNRKRNHPDRSTRDRKHRFEETESATYVVTQIYR